MSIAFVEEEDVGVCRRGSLKKCTMIKISGLANAAAEVLEANGEV
jgi:hypothetical protein